MNRSRRTRRWMVWAVRDARSRWLQVVSIAALLGLGVGMYSAMSSMAAWRTRSAHASFDALRMHDLRVSLAEGSYARAGTLERALARIPARGQVSGAEERLVAPTQVDASTRGRTVIVPGRVVGAPVGGSVDTLRVYRGRSLRAADDGRPVAELERNFADHYDLAPQGTLRVAGGRALRYVGLASGPEYFIVTAPGADFGAESKFAVLFVPLHTAQRLAGQPGRVNQLVVRARPGADTAAISGQLQAELRRALPGTGFTVTGRSQEPSWRVLFKDAEGDQRLMDVFAYLLLGAAAFAAFNLVSRTVEAQRREIGIGMALGVEPRVLAVRPLLLGGQVALLGVALGIPVGLAAGAWLRSVIESFFPLPVVQTPFQLGYFARGALVGLALPMIATFLPVRRAVSVSPVEAIRVGARAARSSGLAWLLKGVRVPGGTLANLPLRNVLRTPRRTGLTALGVAAVVSIVVALAGMLDTFDGTISASRAETLAGAPDRLTVDLAAPRPAGDRLVARVAHARSVGAADTSLRLPSTLSAGGRHLDAYLDLVPPRGRVWSPTLRQGELPVRTPGIVIAQRAADDLHVGLGDTVAVTHPVPTGPRTTRLVTTPLRVTGIHSSPFRFTAYSSGATASALGVGGLVNRLSVTPAPGSGAEAVQRELLALPSVTAVQGASAMTDAVDEQMKQFTDILVVTVAIAVTMALLIAFNSTAINADERVREHATMFACGVPVGRVVRGNVVEAAVTGLLGTVIGIALGWAVLEWITSTAVSETMPDLGILVSVGAGTYVIAVLAGVVAVSVAPLLTLRRLRRTDIPANLRVVE